MNPKMKSAIEKITLNDATFSNEVRVAAEAGTL